MTGLLETALDRLPRKLERSKLLAAKALWALNHDHRGEVHPIFILGVQRSGTSMFIECLSRSVEIQCYTEARHSPAFRNFALHDLSTIKRLCAQSWQRLTVFKPLKDSHRAAEFLEFADDSKIIWVFRRPQDRAKSAVAKFGAHNLNLVRQFACGENLDCWQAAGLSEHSLSVLRRFYHERMNPETAAGLFWYIRNRLFIEQELHREPRAMLLSYEQLANAPAAAMEQVCDFLQCRFDPRMIDGVHQRSVGKSGSRLEPEVAALCDGLYEMLTSIANRKPIRQ